MNHFIHMKILTISALTPSIASATGRDYSCRQHAGI
jgi:hypothetical protein